jgi:uncharacterized protein YkwD
MLGMCAAFLACVALVPSAALAGGKSHTSATAALDLDVLAQLNEIRAAHHLAPLTLSPGLSRAAMSHTREMVTRGYFEHNSANGLPFWKRIEAFYSEGKFGFWSVGENLFWTSGEATSAQSMKAWMASPGHRKNILDPEWRQIGIAAVNSPSAPGTYGGRDVTVITTDFGVRH